jgi:excisionase family DNA binding protein
MAPRPHGPVITETVAPLVLRPDEAAKALRISRWKVYELIRTGELHSVSIGRCRRIPVESVQAYVASALGEDG